MFKLNFKSGIRGTYNVSDNPSFVAEPWSVYPGKHRSNGKLVSVFIFDKTKFESQVNRLCSTSSSTKNPKVIINECYELIKFEVNQLSKLKHPQILTIFEVLEETKTKFLFASEPIVDNLQTVSQKNLDDLSIQKGLLQIAKGLHFLHSYCSIVHLNLQPESVFINNQGDWKLGGFRFLQNLNEISPSERENFYIMNSSYVPFANLNLNFTAPELIIDSTTNLNFANDMWSFGHLIYYLYNDHDLLVNCFDLNSISDYKQEFRKFEMKFYNHKPSELKYLLKNVPEKLYPIFPQLLARYPNDRLTLDHFIECDFFNGSIIKAMWFIDEFSTKSIDEKLMFMQGLLVVDPRTNENLISQFPAPFKSSKLLPLLVDVLVNEFNVLNEKTILDPNTDQLICYSLDIIMDISQSLSQLTFQDKVYDNLFKDDTKKNVSKIATKMLMSSVKVRLTLVEKLSIIQEKTNDKQFIELFKKMLDLVLTSSPKEIQQSEDQKQNQITLQDSFLKYLPNIVANLEFPYIKNTLFPMLCHVFKTTTILSTKLITIDMFENLVEKKIIDKIIITEQLFPIFQNLKSRDKRVVGTVLSFFLRLCKSTHIQLELESMVDTVLPQCLSLAFGCNDCTQLEFKKFMSITNEIQKELIERKLSSLPSTQASTTKFNDKSPPTTFESLLQTQAISDAPKEFPGPQTKTIMQPSRPAGRSPPINKPLQPSSSSSPIFKSNQVSNNEYGQQSSTISSFKPLQNTGSSYKPLQASSVGASKPSQISPISSFKPLQASSVKTSSPSFKPISPVSSFKPIQPTKKQHSPSPNLTLGATSNPTADRLLNTLQSTFDRSQKNNEDEFDDFQSANNSSGGTRSSMKSNNAMKTLPNPPITTNVNYPPGFNSNVILAPKVSSAAHTNQTKKFNSELSDFI
ncbi:Protein kinase-like protein SCY1 [Spathaspora sp. JA1]|nr:Protein kinase-like protein SCY1 [Spathaspora sp. JA1]